LVIAVLLAGVFDLEAGIPVKGRAFNPQSPAPLIHLLQTYYWLVKRAHSKNGRILSSAQDFFGEPGKSSSGTSNWKAKREET
jgi:hypothetical protein